MISRVMSSVLLIVLVGWVGIGMVIVTAAILNFPIGLELTYQDWKLPSTIQYGHIEVNVDRNGADGMLYFITRKLGHFFVYTFITIFLLLLIKMHKSTYKFLLAITSVSTLATIDELIQAFIPHRSALVMDVFVDVVGGFHGLFLYFIFYNLYAKRGFIKVDEKVVG